jgi:NTE family protein
LRGLLEASLYFGASLEVGNAWQNSNDVSLSNSLLAGSLFVGADTFIGPVYLAGGLAEGGNTALYLFVGRPF